MALLRRSLSALALWFGASSSLSLGAKHSQSGAGDAQTFSAEKGGKKYTPDWESLESRPLPDWYEDAKFGIFIHWGLFSVPAYANEWYWLWLDGDGMWPSEWKIPNVSAWHYKTFGKDFKYQDFADMFTAKEWSPETWAKLFQKAGAKYVVLTSKHHEGFTLWPSKYSWNWNAMDRGPKRDLVGDLAKEVRAHNLTFGLYHSMYEWFNPLYLEDKKNNFTTRNFVTTKTMPELHEIVEKYEPDVIFSDGEWETTEEYWGSKEFLTWLYNDSPVKDTVVVNDRWGNTTRLKHGGYYSGEDRQQPGKTLLGHKWENCLTIDRYSWGYNRMQQIENYLPDYEILQQLTSTVAFGGNLLLNVGPTADGIILPIFQERLVSVGDFLEINGEAIYKTRPCKEVQNETAVEGAYYTCKPDQDLAYLSIVPTNGLWPRPGSKLELTGVKSADSVYMLIANSTSGQGVMCIDSGTHVQCIAPSPYDHGIEKGKVHPRGYTLRLKGAVLQAPIEAPVSIPSNLV